MEIPKHRRIRYDMIIITVSADLPDGEQAYLAQVLGNVTSSAADIQSQRKSSAIVHQEQVN